MQGHWILKSVKSVHFGPNLFLALTIPATIPQATLKCSHKYIMVCVYAYNIYSGGKHKFC